MSKSKGPLSGLRIIEFAGIGPGPFAGMMLSDMGAEVIRIDRPGPAMIDPEQDFLLRGRKSILLDLKKPNSVEVALDLIEGADGLIEGLRPGVMERLGLGPDTCHARNPGLVYGRMTGWGQNGPLARSAGHDLNYIAITGALWASGEGDGKPAFPMNLLGDFGGGGMMLAFGMVAALLQAQRTGRGDVVDAAICDGTAALMAMIYSFRDQGGWQDKRCSNLLDGGAPWYGVYECADGGWITIGALEPQFWARLLDLLDLDAASLGDRDDPSTWGQIRRVLTQTFLGQPRAYWVDLLDGSDACFAPVLSPAEAARHPHNVARGVFSNDGRSQPMPAPRFASTDHEMPPPPPKPGRDTIRILEGLGYSPDRIDDLQKDGAVRAAQGLRKGS